MSISDQDRSSLRGMVPLDSLNEQHFNRLMEQSTQIDTIKKGGFAFKQGDMDRNAVYLLSGEVELEAKRKTDDDPEIVTAGGDESSHPLSPSQPRQHHAKCLQQCRVARIQTNELDIMLTWDQEAGGMEVSDLDSEEEESDWMTKLLNNKAFYKIPPANIHNVLMKMEPARFNPNEDVISQGEDGDYFYVIKSGYADVLRKTAKAPGGTKLAELGPGDSFGEEALISNSKRNATIRMNTPGELMRLAKDDFVELLTAPAVNKVNWAQANALHKKGGIWIDIRLPPEYKKSHIRTAVNLPLFFLRSKLDAFKKDKIYIVYCDTGSRSEAAAFVLKQAGFKAAAVEGGLQAMQAQAQAD